MKSRIYVAVLAVLLLSGCVSSSANAPATEDELYEGRVSAEADLQAYEEDDSEFVEEVDEGEEPEDAASADEPQDAQPAQSESARLGADNEQLKSQVADLQSEETAEDAVAPQVVKEPVEGESIVYTCPMHPEVWSEDAESDCPDCGMNLVLELTEPDEAPEPLAGPTVVVLPYAPPLGIRVNDDITKYDELWFELFFIEKDEEIYVDGFELEIDADEAEEKKYSTAPGDLLLLRLKQGLSVTTLGCVIVDKKGNREESYLSVEPVQRQGRDSYAFLVFLDSIQDLRENPEVKIDYWINAETEDPALAEKYLDRVNIKEVKTEQGKIIKYRGIIRIRANTFQFQPDEAINDAGEVLAQEWTTRFETYSDVVAVVRPEEAPDGTVYYNFTLVPEQASDEDEGESVDPLDRVPEEEPPVEDPDEDHDHDG